MVRSRLWIALVAIALIAGTFAVTVARADEEGMSFVAVLSGPEEVPTTNSMARGVAIFHVSEDETMVSFKLIVANINNVVASHIHLAPAGVAGPVVVPLLVGVAPGGGRIQGVIAQGTFTAADFTGPLAGMTVADLVELMLDGQTYVNVHTNDGVPPTNTGPGDFPGGEIRGQIMLAE